MKCFVNPFFGYFVKYWVFYSIFTPVFSQNINCVFTEAKGSVPFDKIAYFYFVLL